MTTALFIGGFVVLPLFGLWTWRLPVVRRMDLAARLAIAGAAGAVLTAVVMALLSLVQLEWSRTVLFVILGVIGFATAPRPTGGGRLARFRRASRPPATEDRPAQDQAPGRMPGDARPPSSAITLAITLFAVITGYALLTARETAGDLHFFWGPKAIGFFRAGGIDPDFLANKINPNADYPPLVPLLYAWSHTVAHQFSWWGALLTTLLFLVGAIAIVRGCSGDADGALLVAATLSFTFAIAFAAGGADPPLLFFETLTLAALTFLDRDPRGRDILAALGLAGAAWTKIEGATFVVAVVIAIVIVQRSVKRALLIAAPAVLLLVGWLVFLVTNDLVFGYGGAKMGIYFSVLPKTLVLTAKSALYELYGLPWLVPIALLVMGRIRRAALPLVVAVLTIGAAIFFYIHVPDPSWWIAASAPRVLLTPLVALLIAAIAATRAPGTASS